MSDNIGLDPSIKKFNNITLEMSLKPFKQNDKEYIRYVCKSMFDQWNPLLKYCDTVSILLWTADGSEILDYSGDLNQPLEWGRYIGNPNTTHEVNSGPRELNLHTRAYTYMENTPSFNYGDLKYIVRTLKTIGEQITGKIIRVGETFDPGPEFAKSAFKYAKHPEICMANTMGAKSFVCCYARLNEDSGKYAAFPNGIPQGTSLGYYLGKQSQEMMKDIGFDYLWFSNGFGFGMETWNTIGAIYDSKVFHVDKMTDIRKKIIDFWTDFRKGCPDYRIETRGTNLSAGIDLARDGVDLKSIYTGPYDILPPPNSPWAALNGDFGLELAGYMSRISEIPDNRYLFRYYIHDPWWANSPWLDRYGREAHDIYLPMAVSRINSEGEITLPTHLNLLTVDDSYGNMPDQVPNEVIPHILQARRKSPDKAGPIVWLYPFDEYHENAFKKDPNRLEEIFYGDWFVIQAINDGFPINTVISTAGFISCMQKKSTVLNESILVTTVPEKGAEVEKELMRFVEKGGKVIVYGPATHASEDFLRFLNIKLTDPIDGLVTISLNSDFDNYIQPSLLHHNKDMSGGGIEVLVENLQPDTRILAKVSNHSVHRDVAVLRQSPDWKGGAICYVRGTNSASFKGGHLLSQDDMPRFFIGGSLMRYALGEIGYSIKYSKKELSRKNPINCISKNNNGYWFSGYVPDQTVEQSYKFPQGAPLFMGTETELKNGYSNYHMPKSWHKECRVFVEQKEGVVACHELAPVEYEINRKIGIYGLKGANVRIYPGKDETNYKAMPHNNHSPEKEVILESRKGTDFEGSYYEYKNITGQLVITW
ncbi:hypothetical protein [Parabacteroides sp. Marseille-P3160]|uniref:hypothetical protein n=1 Tax=Parabacteroides sp. Marseille-P3160 TaxID=1917887 RepID=UPI0011186B00|nr:hypothetical protein [Parabacteroides sp. Marseille-P3160]